MGPAPDERGELLHGPVVLSGAAERLAEPERDFARERGRRPPRRECRPRRHRVVVAPERVAGEREAVPGPGFQRGGRRRLELRERVAGARHLVEPERGPPARVQAPHRELRDLRPGRDLTEERVGLLGPVEPVVGLGEPVPRLRHEVALGAPARRRLEILGRVAVLALGETRAAAFESFRRDPERRAHACKGARRTERRRQLVGRRHDRSQGHPRKLRGRRGNRGIGRHDGRLLDRRLGEGHEPDQVRRRRSERQHGRRRRGGRRRHERGEQDEGEPVRRHERRSPLEGDLLSRAFTAAARSRAQSRSVASGHLLATDSYAVSAAFSSPSCSRARPRPASAR